ncbi:MAG: hypothetical protein DLM61_17750 [Pseudonocardiales bacterium]|nr:MAG: hypothetical protein DLM61_17750 [Pseudonocardiales bacterium]
MGQARDSAGSWIAQVLRSTAPDSVIPPERLGEIVHFLTTLTGQRLQQPQWAQWVSETNDVYNFTLPEQTFAACNDCDTPDKCPLIGQPVPSRLIVAEFLSPLTPRDFVYYVNPENWPHFSAFWESMALIGVRTDFQDSLASGYNAEFRERVHILDQVLEVPLEVGHRIRHDESRVWTRFNIARGHFGGSVPVDIDTGTVSAELIGSGQTRVRATKYVHWSDTSRPDFSSLSCDFGWAEFMVQMAEKSLQEHNGQSILAPDKVAEPSVDDAIKRFVEGVVMDSKNGIDGYVPGLEKLIRRFTSNTWDAGWINDLLAMGQVTMENSGNLANHVLRLADALKAAGERKDDSG